MFAENIFIFSKLLQAVDQYGFSNTTKTTENNRLGRDI